MENMPVVPDKILSEAFDLAAKRQNELELEEQDRGGYRSLPQRADEIQVWEEPPGPRDNRT
jgi:hypothetical protein